MVFMCLKVCLTAASAARDTKRDRRKWICEISRKLPEGRKEGRKRAIR